MDVVMRLAMGLVGLIGCGRIDFDPIGGAVDGSVCAFGPFGSITNLTAANSPGTEFAPSLSADGLTLYFSSDRPGGAGGFDIWTITRPTLAGAWSAPLDLAAVNTARDEYGPAVTRDDLTLYLAGAVGTDLDILSAHRNAPSASFGTPSPVPGVNSTSVDDTPSPTADDLELVFRSERPPGAVGSSDVYLATRTTTASPFTVRSLSEINSPASDQGAAITADGLTVTFGSTRGGGDYDLYLATRPDREALFSPPSRIDELATPGYDDDAMISDDLRTIYFVSDRPGTSGPTDIWFATRACL